MKTYYLYRHVRLDKDEVFYVGIGTKNEKGKYLCKIYSRGYLKSPTRRSLYWQNVYKSCGKNISIDILFETSSLDEIITKEKEFILLYGRKDLGLGTLVNHTDGGDGTFGYTWTEEQKQLRSSKMRGKDNHFFGKKHSPEIVEFLREKGKEEYLTSKIKDFVHTEITKKKLSDKGKERAKNGNLPKLYPQKGSSNFFAKKYLVINHNTGDKYLVQGGIKKFCDEYNLSYDFCKKFVNKGKCILEDVGRAREKSKNTENWEFKTIFEENELINAIKK